MKDLNELLCSYYEKDEEYLGCIPDSIVASDCQTPSLDKKPVSTITIIGDCGTKQI